MAVGLRQRLKASESELWLLRASVSKDAINLVQQALFERESKFAALHQLSSKIWLEVEGSQTFPLPGHSHRSRHTEMSASMHAVCFLMHIYQVQSIGRFVTSKRSDRCCLRVPARNPESDSPPQSRAYLSIVYRSSISVTAILNQHKFKLSKNEDFY